MNREAIEKLHLDRRLIRRRGWISAGEVEKALGELPDVAGKIAPPEGSGAGESASASGGSATTPDSPRAE